MPNRYHFFWNGPLSQWQGCQFDMDGTHYTSAEQAMMHAKATLFENAGIADEILRADDPCKQKALGRQVTGFDQSRWSSARYDIVVRINLAKFSQNKGLRRKLFQTGRLQLVEASPIDTVWGIGLDAETARNTPEHLWPGQNLLGRALMDVRTQLRVLFSDETTDV
ncbi:MAG: NADAR family protein [Paracoccaceae bacterium]